MPISYRNVQDRFFDVADMVVKQYGKDDTVAMSEAWNDFTDSLCKDGDITDLQYHYCPAYDDNTDMDDDETLDFILDEMGVTFNHGPLQTTRGDKLMSDMPRHWLCTITRGTHSFSTWYSQGEAHTAAPDRNEVLASLFMDIEADDYDRFEDWAESIGYDPDSRSAEKIYNACKAIAHEVKVLFKESEIDDLREHFSECGL